MDQEKGQIIVSQGATAGAAQVHHREFPEIRAQGHDAADAAAQLVNQLTRALDSALTTWRRETIQKAIADAQEFSTKPG